MDFYRLLRHYFLSFAAVASAANLSAQESPPTWCCDTGFHAPRASFNVTPGNRRTILGTELFIPLCQQPDALIFVDLRGVQDNEINREGNVGIGCRRLYRNCLIGGGYLYGDFRRTSLDHSYFQVTAGIEVLTEWFDARANIYIPQGTQNRFNAGFTPAGGEAIEGFGHLLHVVRLEGGSVSSFEKPLHGFDAEIGAKLPTRRFVTSCFEVRAFIGGYHFEAANVPTVRGPRGRLEATLLDALAPIGWYDVDLTFEAQASHDDVRRTQKYVGLNLTVPLQRPHRRQRPCGLRRRLSQRVQRDVDIVTSVGNKVRYNDSTVLRTLQSPIDTDQRVMYVDNTAKPGGDGSIEHPFNTLSDGLHAATETWDIIYIRTGDGTARGLTGNFVLPEFEDIHIVGAGTDFIVENILIAPKGTAPRLSASDGAALDVSHVQEAHISGITIDTANDIGIVAAYNGTPAPTLTIRDVAITGSHRALDIACNNCTDASVTLSNVSLLSTATVDAVALSYNATQAPTFAWHGGAIQATHGAVHIESTDSHHTTTLFEGVDLVSTGSFHAGVTAEYLRSNNARLTFRDSHIATPADHAQEALSLSYSELSDPLLTLEKTTISGVGTSSREGAAVVYDRCVGALIDVTDSVFRDRTAGLYVLNSLGDATVHCRGSSFYNNRHAGMNLTNAIGTSSIDLQLLGGNTFYDNATVDVAMHNAFSRGAITASKTEGDTVDAVSATGTGTVTLTPEEW